MPKLLPSALVAILSTCCQIGSGGVASQYSNQALHQPSPHLGFIFFPQFERRLFAVPSNGGPLKLRSGFVSLSAGTRTLEMGAHAASKTDAINQTNTGHMAKPLVLGPKFDRAVAAIACFWWRKHQQVHRQVRAEDIEIDYESGMLGSGAFGEVYRASVVSGEHCGTKAIVKRAKDGEYDEQNPNAHENEIHPESMTSLELEDFVQKMDEQQQAFHFLQVEAFINDIVQTHCPSIAARYLGLCRRNGVSWLVFEDIGGESLDCVLNYCAEVKSLKPLASALHIQNFEDGDTESLHRLVNLLAWQLMNSCRELQRAGVAHRDLKPENLLISDGRLLLIDFGASAAMGLPEMTGYDYRFSPCDPAYAPPEDLIDEKAWPAYDVFSASLILVRVLFQPFWESGQYLKFSDSFKLARFDLDLWLRRIISHDPRCKLTSRMPRWLRSLQHVVLPRSKSEAVSEHMDQEFLSLAQTCPVDAQAADTLQLCFFKTGLEVLNIKDGGICWETLREMLCRCPRTRMGADEVLERLKVAGAVTDGL